MAHVSSCHTQLLCAFVCLAAALSLLLTRNCSLPWRQASAGWMRVGPCAIGTSSLPPLLGAQPHGYLTASGRGGGDAPNKGPGGLPKQAATPVTTVALADAGVILASRFPHIQEADMEPVACCLEETAELFALEFILQPALRAVSMSLLDTEAGRVHVVAQVSLLALVCGAGPHQAVCAAYTIEAFCASLCKRRCVSARSYTLSGSFSCSCSYTITASWFLPLQHLITRSPRLMLGADAAGSSGPFPL